jgi:hypothetical protein
MWPNFLIRIVFIAGSLILLAGALSEWRHWSSTPTDFEAYYTAASMIRSHENLQIYAEVERNSNLLLGYADRDTVFARTSRAYGFTDISVYIYPPALADLMAPLTVFSPLAALVIWRLLNLTALLSSIFMLLRMLGMRSIGHACMVAVFLFTFRPMLSCFDWGQVPLILLFLLTAGLSLYFRGCKNWAGLLFALAIAIKLTPFIVLLPFIVWRDWKIVRASALWGAAILGALLIVNGWGTLNLYFLHVLPLMSNGAVNIDNRTFSNMLTVYCHGLAQNTPPFEMIWAERLVAILVYCYAIWLIRLNREDNLPENSRLETVAIFLLLSCCCSPVSWIHAYALSAPALVIIGKRIWEQYANAAEAILLTMFLLSLSLSSDRATYFVVMTPLLGVALGLMGLRRLRLERILNEPAT